MTNVARPLVALIAICVALVAVATASSRPSAGVTVTPQQVMALPYFSGLNIQTYILVASARWAPPTIRTEGAIYVTVCKEGRPAGRCSPTTGVQVKSFGESGVVPHTSESHAGLQATFPGEKYELKAKWRAYNPVPVGSFDGEATSKPTILSVPEALPPRFKESTKLYLADSGILLYAECASLSSIGSGSASTPGLAGPIQALGNLQCGSGLGFNQMANDPVDPNFRVVAKPKIPPAPTAKAEGGLSAAAAAAFTKLFAAQAKEIGYGRAVLISINRAQGAQAKKQVEWERKQMRAAGTYASRLAASLLLDVALRQALARSLNGPGLADASVSAEDVGAFRDSLIKKGLPRAAATGLSKLGFTRAEQRLMYGWLLAADAPSLGGNVRSRIIDPKVLARLRGTAAELKAFAKKAARDPLRTGT